MQGLKAETLDKSQSGATRPKASPGQQTLEIVVSGCVDFREAQRALQQRLPELVRLEPAQPSRRARG